MNRDPRKNPNVNLFVTDPSNTIPAPPPDMEFDPEPHPDSTDKTATLDLWHPVFDDLDEEVSA